MIRIASILSLSRTLSYRPPPPPYRFIHSCHQAVPLLTCCLRFTCAALFFRKIRPLSLYLSFFVSLPLHSSLPLFPLSLTSSPSQFSTGFCATRRSGGQKSPEPSRLVYRSRTAVGRCLRSGENSSLRLQASGQQLLLGTTKSDCPIADVT